MQNRRRLYDSYAGMFRTFEVFCQVMDQCTENYECLVINNNAKSNKIEDQVFWYKADKHPPFQMGGRIFWEHHSNHFNDSYENQEEDGIMPAKKGPIINVKKAF